MNYLIIGYGNTLRRDDGAGYRVAEQVESWGLDNVRSLPCHQLTPELADDLAQVDVAIFIDAIAPSEHAPTTVQVEHLTEGGFDATLNLGHGLNPRSLLALSQVVYDRVPNSYQILIPTETFDFGEQVSATAEANMAIALEWVRGLLGGENVGTLER